MKSRSFCPLWTLGVIFLVSLACAHAHPGHGSHGAGGGGFIHGLAHPWGGLDHLLAMFAVGLWAAQMGGRALWLVPLAFLSVMVSGGVLGMMGVSLPWVEGGILASILALGVLIAVAARPPLWAGMAIVGFFALFHGHAHGWEIPLGDSRWAYGAGFVISTAVLHGMGLAAGSLAGRSVLPELTRCAGVVVAVLAVWMFVW